MIKAITFLFFIANALFLWLIVDNSALTISMRFGAFLFLALNIFTAAAVLAKRG
ncbi:MAG: hypothetical protein ACR2IJ_05920 [Fluviibacter sp.]